MSWLLTLGETTKTTTSLSVFSRQNIFHYKFGVMEYFVLSLSLQGLLELGMVGAKRS